MTLSEDPNFRQPIVGPGGEKPEPTQTGLYPRRPVIRWNPYQWVSVSIIGRLVKRFLLSDHQQVKDSLVLYRSIQPVTQVDELLKTYHIRNDGNKDISAAAGTYIVFYTVPSGKRWTIKGWYVSPTVASSNLKINTGSTSYEIQVNPAATAEIVDIKLDVILEEGWTLGRTTTGNGGDNAEWIVIYYCEEDAYT